MLLTFTNFSSNHDSDQDLALDNQRMHKELTDAKHEIEILKRQRAQYMTDRMLTEDQKLAEIQNLRRELATLSSQEELKRRKFEDEKRNFEREIALQKIKLEQLKDELEQKDAALRTGNAEVLRTYDRVSSLVKKVFRTESLLEKEMQNSAWYKKRVVVLEEKMDKIRKDSGIVDTPMFVAPNCNICRFDYEEEFQPRTPKVLKCGHTICQECAERIAKGTKTLHCPFDRRETTVESGEMKHLPKNFAIVEVIEMNKKAL